MSIKEANAKAQAQTKQDANKMYTIIYWDGENSIMPILNTDNTLVLFDDVNKADEYAGFVETISKQMCRSVETRVISIEGVSE